MADGDVVLAAATELGPVFDDRVVVCELTAIDEAMDHRGHDSLRRREARRHRLSLPRRADSVAGTCPHIDHGFAVVEDGNGSATDGRSLRHQLVKLLADGREVGMNKTLHGNILLRRRRHLPILRSAGTAHRDV